MSEGVPVSATDNYTPTTEEVRSDAVDGFEDRGGNRTEGGERFDRWLAAERAKAWDEGRAATRDDYGTRRYTKNPYREVQ